MTKLRVLIIDDEPLARARTRTFLCGHPSVEVTGEYGNGIEALSAIRSEHPDIAFLDVQMPGCDGLQLIAELRTDERPAIVLVTAHERYEAAAVAAHVAGFLLKPFDRERFDVALGRAVEQVHRRRGSDLK